MLIGGTVFAFIDMAAAGTLDYLFVDEAGQVSVANLVAMGPAAKNLVLLGDQMQLGQPIQGSHPGESGRSTLEYLLQEHATIRRISGSSCPAPGAFTRNSAISSQGRSTTSAWGANRIR